MSLSHSAASPCVELDRLARKLVRAYEQLDQDQIIALRELLLLHHGIEETDHAIADIHRQIAEHRFSCPHCLQLDSALNVTELQESLN